MNLRLIEKRFQNLEVRANYLNYKFNPHTNKVPGIPQHAYLQDLRADHECDLKVYGKDPFVRGKVEAADLAQAEIGARLGRKLRAGGIAAEMAVASSLREVDKEKLGNMFADIDEENVRGAATTEAFYPGSLDAPAPAHRPKTRQVRRNIPKNQGTSFPGTKSAACLSAARTVKSQQSLLRRKIQFYKNQTHYEWDLGAQVNEVTSQAAAN